MNRLLVALALTVSHTAAADDLDCETTPLGDTLLVAGENEFGLVFEGSGKLKFTLDNTNANTSISRKATSSRTTALDNDDQTAVSVDLDGDEFIGQEALRKQKVAGLTKRLETIVMSERGVPREGSTVLSGGTELGSVVSGMLAPTAGIFAANVFLPRSHGDVGTEVVVDIRGKSKQAAVVKRPLYRLA